MKKNKKILGWQIPIEEFEKILKIKNNFRYTTISQVIYHVMYTEKDLNQVFQESIGFARKNNIKNKSK
jgi:hypothetical protein